MEKSIKKQLLNCRQAKRNMAKLRSGERAQLLRDLAIALRENKDLIIAANSRDLNKMDPSDSKYDRLRLDEERIEELAKAVEAVASLPDPTDVVLTERVLENGLLLQKKSVALGVVAVIYESRPNVTIDVASLCLRSGNVCLLRGGSDAWESNSVLVGLIRQVLDKAGLDPNMVQLLPVERELLMELLHAKEDVDILIPRGSQGLIDFVRTHAKVPVIETGAGVCHTYVDQTADLQMAAKIIANAKISRPSVCNALDTILVDKEVVSELIAFLVPYFKAAEVQVMADEVSYPYWLKFAYPYLHLADATDFGREFLSLACSMKSVSGLESALEHISEYSSKHSECIVSSNSENISNFMHAVDAAAVYANASTRFTDGAEFGLGAEIGISTQKLHARGPFALEKLVCEKWFVTGHGQIR